jgi:cytoskeletal protein RodZ
MASFGENLQREREMRGVTLEEIANATKISVRFLHAIETEEFSKLPGGIFSRSFIRAYSRYLGLDEERVLAEYQLLAQPKEDVNLTRVIISRPPSPRESSRTPVIAVLVAAVMLASGYALFHYSRRASEAPESTSNMVPGVAAPSAAPSQTPAATGSAAAGNLSATPSGASGANPPGAGPQAQVGSTPASQAASAPFSSQAMETGGRLVLQVAANEQAWTAVEADGKMTLQRVLNPNEVVTFKAKEYFNVTTGNAQGVILTLNGETLKPLGRRGEVKSIHLTRDDLKNPAP